MALATSTKATIPISVYALSVGAFGIGTTEFVILGLLLNIASEFNISISLAAYTVSFYAIGVVIGAPVITPLLSRYSKKPALIGLMLIFTLGNLYCAFAPTLTHLLIARVITAFAHASFFGIGSVLAAELAPAGRKSSAISAMFLGATLANIIGVPLGTFIGQTYGWRVSFYMVTFIGILSALAVLAYVPPTKKSKEPQNLLEEIRALVTANVLKCFAITILGFGGVFTLFTFIVPMLTQVTGFSEKAMVPLLALVGGGMILGNIIGGRLSDRNARTALIYTLLFLVLILVLFPLALMYKVTATLFVALFGMAMFATIPPLQMQALSSSTKAPTLIAACNIAAFNLGNAIGAWFGGLALINGISLEFIPLLAAAISAFGLVLAFM